MDAGIRRSQNPNHATDADARRMKMPGGAIQPADNVQFATDVHRRAIVGVEGAHRGRDGRQSRPMPEQVERRSGRKVEEHLFDGGFANNTRSSITVPINEPRAEASAAIRTRETSAINNGAIGRIELDLLMLEWIITRDRRPWIAIHGLAADAGCSIGHSNVNRFESSGRSTAAPRHRRCHGSDTVLRSARQKNQLPAEQPRTHRRFTHKRSGR